MASNAAETLIGAVVLASAAGFLVYAAQTADVGGGNGYEVTAQFRQADGLGVGGDVRLAGVKIGSVVDLDLDTETYFAVATLAIDEAVGIPGGSTATLTSDGLLGGSYVSIDPAEAKGEAPARIPDGGEIAVEEVSVNLLDLLAKAISGGGAPSIGADAYDLLATFRKADGIAVGSEVRMAGVGIGTVTEMALDARTFQAVTRLAIRGDVQVPGESSARIATDGLIGGAYIEIEPGNADYPMEDGEEILITQGSVNLLDLFARAIHGSAGGGASEP